MKVYISKYYRVYCTATIKLLWYVNIVLSLKRGLMKVFKKKKIVYSIAISMTFHSFLAMAEVEKRSYPEIYPFVPFSEEHIVKSLQDVSEDNNAIRNIYELDKKGLKRGKTSEQPWMSTYWPLNKALIADPYTPTINVFKITRELSWETNYRKFLQRKQKVHTRINELTQDELDTLAPSEKYDILLGDESFDLTNKLWDYAQKWGSAKENSFLSSLDIVGGGALDKAQELVDLGLFQNLDEAMPRAIEMRGGLAENIATNLISQGKYSNYVEAMPEAMEQASQDADNYVLVRKNSLMALWEGICHGWSTAAGIVPRPKKTVTIKLPNGKNLKFFPDDLKGLASLLWANSLVQDSKFVDENGEVFGGGIISEGLRCNQKAPKRDEWGRYYDDRADAYSKKLEPRCVGVHPAIWHLALANIIGNQGRSFVVERKIKAAVDNHPLTRYAAEYFNPKTGDYGTLKNSITALDESDPFINFRNPKAKAIVGIKMTMTYVNWGRPQREAYDSPAKDDLKDIDMMYDLELDEEGNVVGGQWRLTEKGKVIGGRASAIKNTQPDFFWVVTKDWKKFFKEADVSTWKNTNALPPSDWLEAARGAHNFTYMQTHDMGFSNKCKVKKRRKIVEVPCEHKFNRPQPLVNVVNTLIDLSRK